MYKPLEISYNLGEKGIHEGKILDLLLLVEWAMKQI